MRSLTPFLPPRLGRMENKRSLFPSCSCVVCPEQVIVSKYELRGRRVCLYACVCVCERESVAKLTSELYEYFRSVAMSRREE